MVSSKLLKFLAVSVCFTTSSLYGVVVSNESELNTELRNAISSTPFTITFDTNIAQISLNSIGFPVNSDVDFISTGNTLTIEGNGKILDGNNAFRGFFVRGDGSGTGGTVTIQDVNFVNCKAKGGDGKYRAAGGSGGSGGGGGLGGALFVGTDTTVNLTNCTFSNSSAVGGSCVDTGALSQFGGSGGGGLGGDGGRGGQIGFNPFLDEAGGGGGGGGFSFNGANGTPGNSFTAEGGGGAGLGQNGIIQGNGGGNLALPSPLGGGTFPSGNGANGGGGAAGDISGSGDGGNASLSPTGGGGGGGGGISAFSINDGNGGQGGYGGGGGGAAGVNINPSLSGGDGGFGAGGGGAAQGTQDSQNPKGGDGGFGAGGGGGGILSVGTPKGGTGGFGGGNGQAGSPNRGGGGAGFGGSIFLETDATLNIIGSVSFTNSSVTGGTGFQNGSALGTDIFMMSSSQLDFNISSPVTLENPIEGDQSGATGGGLAKNGAGLLTLTGDNTYTGKTTVEGDEMRIIKNGSVITNTQVNSGATISGNFRILDNKNLLILGGGTVSPGIPGVLDGIGTIIVTGNYTQNPNGIYLTDITPTGMKDQIQLSSGQANLDEGAILRVFLGKGNYVKGATYLVIKGDITGTSTNYTTPDMIGPQSNNVNIQVDILSDEGVLITILTTRVFIDQKLFDPAAIAVAECLRKDAPPGDSDLGMITAMLGLLDDKEVNRVLNQMSPAPFGALEWINARNNSYVADLLAQHLFTLDCCNDRCCDDDDCYSCESNCNFWINGFTNLMDNKEKINSLNPFDAKAFGVLAGYDYYCDPCMYFGGALGYTYTDLDWNLHGGDGTVHSFYGALYGSSQWSCFEADISLIGGGNKYDLDRRVKFKTPFTNFDRVARSDPWGGFFTGHFGLAGHFARTLVTFQPFGVVDYHYFHRQSFDEKGAQSLNLDVRSHDQHIMRYEAGLNLLFPVSSCDNCAAPYLGVSWVREDPINDSIQKANLEGESCLIKAPSYSSSNEFVSPQVGINFSNAGGFSLILGYKGLYSRKITIHEAEFRASWLF